MTADSPTRHLAARATPLSFKLGAAVLATLVGFVICEAAARLIYPAPPDPTRQPPIVYVYDPEIRYTLAPNQHGWIDDGFVNVNSLGFRGREPLLPKPAGRFRAVFIGDSVAFGWGVGDDETFAARVETLLRERSPQDDLDVVNLAVGGYDTRQEITLLERNLARLEPDLVLVGFYANDVPESLQDDQAGTDGGTRIAVANPQPGQIMHLNPVPASWLEATLRRSRIAYTAGRALNRIANRGEWGSSGFSMELDVLRGRDSADLDRAWQATEQQFARLRGLADGRFPVGVIVLPSRDQVMGQYPDAKYQSRVRAIANTLGFFVVDPLPALAAAPNASTLYIPYDRNHPSAAGHRVIGDDIFRYLTEHGVARRSAARSSSAGHATEHN